MSRPPDTNRSAVPVLAALSIALALAGQYLFTLSQAPSPWAILCFALAAACLLLAERLAHRG
jgi:hypothetical protein